MLPELISSSTHRTPPHSASHSSSSGSATPSRHHHSVSTHRSLATVANHVSVLQRGHHVSFSSGKHPEHHDERRSRVTVSVRRASGGDGHRASPGGGNVTSPVGRERKKSAVEREQPKRGVSLTVRETIPEGSPSPGREDKITSGTSALVNQDGAKRRNIAIWPEWNEAEIAAERWDAQVKAKEKVEKGTKAVALPVSPLTGNLFEDPEGRCELPPVLKAVEWKRPHDFITEKSPVVVDVEGMNSFDLFTANEVIAESETMRWITSQITSLWNMNEIKALPDAPPLPPIDPNNLQETMFTHSWRPWEHIYAMAKLAKGGGVNYPQYNPYGKYVVKLYWMGCWRKLIVDDSMPFDEHGNLLLPATTHQHELWPMLLTKALLKVAALDNTAGGTSCEFGDFSVVHCVTGWLPEIIPLQCGHMDEVWKMLKASLPEFTLPDLPQDPSLDPTAGLDGLPNKDDKAEKERLEKAAVAEKTDKANNNKKVKEDKKKKEKDDGKLKAPIVEEQTLPEHPEVIVFAAYHGVPKCPERITMMHELADSFEMLRHQGFSHCYPHPVLVNQTRSCPLQRPPPQEKIPAWKTIRPKKNHSPDEGLEIEKPIQSVHVFSPFLHYKLPFTEEHPLEPCETVQSDDKLPLIKSSSVPSMAKLSLGGKEVTKLAEDLKISDLKHESTDKIGSGKKRQKTKDLMELTTPEKNEKSPPEKQVPSSRAAKRSSTMQAPKDVKSAADVKSKPGDSKKDGRSTVFDDQSRAATTMDAETVWDGDAALETDVVEEKKPPKVTQAWMDFDIFCKCFRHLVVYHKPNTYLHNHRQSDLKMQSQQPAAAPAERKGDKKALAANVTAPVEDKEKSPYYLFVDSLKPTEIVVSLSAICHWNDPVPSAPPKEETKLQSKTAVLSPEHASGPEQTAPVCESTAKEPLQPGMLLAEQVSWKSLTTGQTVLRLRTTGTRASVLCLPEGRHVLRFNVTSPLGYQLHLCSATHFVFGDEEKVVAECVKESCRFIDNAIRTATALGKCLQTFGDSVKYEKAHEEFASYHCPVALCNVKATQKHREVVTTALYASIRKILTDAQLATPDMSFAWRVLNMDATTKNPLGLPHGIVSRPTTGATSSDRASSTGGKKTAFKKQPALSSETSNSGEAVESRSEIWKNREITDADHVAATKLQARWRGYYVRKIRDARRTGSDACLKVQEQLTKAWAAIEPLSETCGTIFLRTLCRMSPENLSNYPFYKDEWNRVTYTDYQGVYPDHPPNTWFLVFREVFYVTEDILCLPKLSGYLSSCSLRVINNDTGEELPRLFGKVCPHVYKKNRLGYTFVGDAKSGATTPSNPGQWRMRLIGSAGPLPAPSRNEVNTSFNVLELHEHYIPNAKNIIFRNCVRVTQDHLTTIQMSTSKPDVQVKLSIIDGDHEVLSCEGIGHVVLPSFIFHRDPPTSEEELIHIQPSSRSSARLSRNRLPSQNDLRKHTSERYSPRQLSTSPRRSLEDINARPHKYYIQAVVMNCTWPLSQAQWEFVQSLKDNEMNEQKDPAPVPVASVERSTTPVRGKGKEKPTGRANKAAAAVKEKEKPAKNPSLLFNEKMPHWTLRVASDADLAETSIEVRKDTERVDAIRAMKLAWEEAEPGRAAKAKMSRLTYLESHLLKSEDIPSEAPLVSASSGSGTSTILLTGASSATQMTSVSGVGELGAMTSVSGIQGNAVLTNVPPAPKEPKEKLLPLDFTPFLRKTTEFPRLLDELEIERQTEEKRAEIQAFRQIRCQVTDRREQERKLRNALKSAQIKLYEQMQDQLSSARETVTLDAARATVKEPRETYRQRLLEQERLRLEAAASLESAMRADQEKSVADKKGGAAGQKSPRSPVNKKKK